MSAAATETSCFGDTSMRSTRSGATTITSPAWRQTTRSSVSVPSSSIGGVRLGDVVLRLFHRREVDHLVGDLAVLHAAERRLDEAVLVHPREGRERVDQADIRAFRRLDRADAAVMGRVHVAHLEAGALAGQTARAERRKAALVGDLGERVGLVHELRQLRGAEELAHRRRRRLGVDQVLRHDRVDIDRRHALLDGALHAQQAEAVLVLHELADRAHAAVAEMVDVVDLALAVAQVDERPARPR